MRSFCLYITLSLLSLGVALECVSCATEEVHLPSRTPLLTQEDAGGDHNRNSRSPVEDDQLQEFLAPLVQEWFSLNGRGTEKSIVDDLSRFKDLSNLYKMKQKQKPWMAPLWRVEDTMIAPSGGVGRVYPDFLKSRKEEILSRLVEKLLEVNPADVAKVQKEFAKDLENIAYKLASRAKHQGYYDGLSLRKKIQADYKRIFQLLAETPKGTSQERYLTKALQKIRRFASRHNIKLQPIIPINEG